ncbi:MAG: hypothetical protein AAGE61_22355 [Pseudomonadota bacterium]
MNKFMMIGRAQLGHQNVDVHAVATFRCNFARTAKKVMAMLTKTLR